MGVYNAKMFVCENEINIVCENGMRMKVKDVML